MNKRVSYVTLYQLRIIDYMYIIFYTTSDVAPPLATIASQTNTIKIQSL